MFYDITIIENNSNSNSNIVHNNMNNMNNMNNANNIIQICSNNMSDYKKNVRFNSWNIVYPNPNIIETETMRYLWWSENDKNDARFTMYKEISDLQKKHPNINIQQAMKLLYQPNNLKIYDPKNFTS